APIQAQVSSSTKSHQRVRPDFILDQHVPLRSHAEQRRVVSRIKECVSRVDEMQRLREETEKENNFLEASFVGDFLESDVARRGPKTPLGQVLRRVQYGTSQKASEDSTGTPILRMGNIVRNRLVVTNGLKYLNLSPKELVAYKLNDGDILF